MMKQFKLSILLTILVLSSYAQQNTILIISDDVSPDYFGFFSTTTDTAHTPNLRNLANKAVRFTKAWASPICSPTRAGIFTGRYSFRTGVGQVITSAASPQIDTAEMSIAKLLKWYAPIKYNTACVGKWHLNNNQPMKRLYPNVMGYDFYSGNFNGALGDYYNWTRIKNGIQDTVTTYSTTQNINDAIDWMDTMNSSKPFFLWIAFNAPHSPYHLPPYTLCDTTGLSGTTAHINANKAKYFKASIEAMDSEIGRLIQYLTIHNLMDSTNIIFMGDNGSSGDVAQISNPSKAKGTIYNYGVHVPLFVTGPSVISPNRVSSELVNTPDLFATIAEMSGFSNWQNSIPTTTKVDSKSFLPILKNQTTSVRTWIFSEQFQSPSVVADGKTIRNSDYHLLRFDNGTEEFYNQALDKEENNNLLTGSMFATDIANYHFLCDTITSLIGGGSCKPLSIENLKGPEMLVYPNPFSKFIAIRNKPSKENFILYNALGNLIYQGIEIHQQDFSALHSGVYFLRCGSKYIKLIKQ